MDPNILYFDLGSLILPQSWSGSSPQFGSDSEPFYTKTQPILEKLKITLQTIFRRKHLLKNRYNIYGTRYKWIKMVILFLSIFCLNFLCGSGSIFVIRINKVAASGSITLINYKFKKISFRLYFYKYFLSKKYKH